MILSHHRKQCYCRDPCVPVTRCLHSETGCHVKDMQKLGALHAVRKTGRKVWSSFPPSSKTVTYLREMKGEVNSTSHLTGSRMLRWNRFCHCPSSTVGYKQLLALGWGCAQRLPVSHQFVYRLSRVRGVRAPWHLPAAYQSIELNNHHSL